MPESSRDIASTPATPGRSDVLIPIQLLRAAAAIAVAMAHIGMDLHDRLGLAFIPTRLGAAGVDVFFVISGFIMVHSSRRLFGQPGGAAIFLRRRLARIVPLYWAATALFLAWMTWLNAPAPPLSWFLSSAVFLPATGPSGFVMPFYGLGWTLNYEMFFYCVFAAAIALPRRAAVATVAGALIGFTVLRTLVPLPTALAYWSHAVIIEFVLGMGVAYAFGAGIRLSRTTGWLLIAAGVALFVATQCFDFDYFPAPTKPSDWPPRFVCWGIPALLIVAGAALRDPLAAEGFFVRCARKLGDASYAMYLFHPFAMGVMQLPAVWALFTYLVPLRGGAYHASMGYLAAAFTLSGALVLSLVVHEAFERPVLRLLTRKPRRASPALQPSAATPPAE
jgi:exopolysaccharide production protein ExoZ